MKYTIGLDFGTHQTKCCVEERDNNYKKYYFLSFMNTSGQFEYRLPSVVKVTKDDKLEYGFIDSASNARVFRYFKQGTFNPEDSVWNESINASIVSIWYLTYLILCLKSKIGKYFDINIGIPTDSTSYAKKKNIAVQLLDTAYHLAEKVFKENMEDFLNATYLELLHVTPYKQITEEKCKEICKEYGIRVFPEAWACLRPLLRSKRLTNLNMMIDIGGGTTDISLFSVVNDGDKTVLKIFYYTSVNRGLNYLYKNPALMERTFEMLENSLDMQNVNIYNSLIDKKLKNFMYQFESEFRFAAQGMFDIEEIDETIKDKQTIYVGGGSTYKNLRQKRRHFQDVRLIDDRDWEKNNISDYQEVRLICPILATSYGLAISEDEGSINTQNNLYSLFDGIRKAARYKREAMEIKRNTSESSFGKNLGGFNYMDDWDAMK